MDKSASMIKENMALLKSHLSSATKKQWEAQVSSDFLLRNQYGNFEETFVIWRENNTFHTELFQQAGFFPTE